MSVADERAQKYESVPQVDEERRDNGTTYELGLDDLTQSEIRDTDGVTKAQPSFSNPPINRFR